MPFNISMSALLFPVISLSALVIALLVYVALLSHHKKSSQEPLQLVGRIATVEKDLSPEGFILIKGELWPACAVSDASIARVSANVRVVGVRGHLLVVERLD